MLKKLILTFVLAASHASASVKMFVDDPEVLVKLEEKGFDFSRLVLGETTWMKSNDKIALNSLYKGLVTTIESDLMDAKSKDPSLAVGMSSSHRQFDKNWLKSPYSMYELVGVINRIDRRSFDPMHCGEIRFIYRLAYKTTGTRSRYSRLPMTVNAVFFLKSENGECRATAAKWEDLQNLISARAPTALDGVLGIEKLKAVEINLQIVRWPSTVRPDFGGYAEYLMRVFRVEGGTLKAHTLENMPDVEKIKGNPALKTELLKWLSDPSHLAKVDNGIAVLPEGFLATKAISVALQGSHRLRNAPFTEIFSEEDFARVGMGQLKVVKSGHGLLRRLNDLTCVGCHQGRTIAGFHFLGKDRKETISVNSISVSASGHFLSEQPRRQSYLQSVLNRGRIDDFRDFSVRARSDEGKTGAHCGLGDSTFSSWTCADGFQCEPIIEDNRVSRTGICQAKSSRAGSACRHSKISHASNPSKDKLSAVLNINCRSGQFCEEVSVGFPSGMCSGGCDNLRDGEICGSIAILKPFNDCLAAGRVPFDTCLTTTVRPGALQECNESRLCRDDYICTKVGENRGACIPPYFLFQLRIDGHPKAL